MKISKDSKYLNHLHDYITHKEQELREANNKLHDETNLNILKYESQDLMERVQRAKSQGQDISFIKPEVDLIVQKYERDAGGDNKYKLLTDFLNNVAPSLYGEEEGPKSGIRDQ